MNQTDKYKNPKIDIIIVDDNKKYIEAIKVFVEMQLSDFEVVEEYENGAKFIEAMQTRPAQKNLIVLMDIEMPILNGIETTKRIISQFPELKIIALSNYDNITYFKIIEQIGASGYVLKDMGYSELGKAMYTVLQGKKYFLRDVA